MKKKTSKKGSRKAQDARKRRERRRQKTQNREKGLSCKPLFEGLPDAGELVQIWQQEHGPDIECQAFREFVRLKKQNEEAWAAGLCQGLELGSAAALCAYGMEPRTPWDTAPGMRRLDEAFAGSATCEAHKESLRRYEELFLGEAQLLHSGKEELSDEERETARGRALGLTALEAACEQDFPAAFVEFFKQAPRFVSFWLLREDGRTTTSEQCHWLVRGMELDIESCVVLLARELRRGTFLPLSAEEEEALLEKLYRHALKGSWEALHELILLLAGRPAFWTLPLADQACTLLSHHVDKESATALSCMLWVLYFGALEPPLPPLDQKLVMSDVRDILEEDPSLPLLHCLSALHDFRHGQEKRGYQRLLDCRELEEEQGYGERNALRLLAMLPHSGKDNLRLPDEERVVQLLRFYNDDVRLLTGYLWQGLVCNEGLLYQDEWLETTDAVVLEASGRLYMQGLLALHGLGGHERDVERALELLALAATNHFLPALGLLADITGRGLYGCKAGPYQGRDWVEEGCRYLEPRAMAVQGLRLLQQGGPEETLAFSEQKVTSPWRLAGYDLTDLFEWCGRQDQDCLCQACSVVACLEGLVAEDARELAREEEAWAEGRADKRYWDDRWQERLFDSAGDPSKYLQDEEDVKDDPEGLWTTSSLEQRAELAGMDLANALILAQATADAGTFLFLASELQRLAAENEDKAWDAWEETGASRILIRAAEVCLDRLERTPRRKTLPAEEVPDMYELVETSLPLLLFFCLDRARFFGEPAAEERLAAFSKEDTDSFRQLVSAMNLTTPPRRFICRVDNLIL